MNDFLPILHSQPILPQIFFMLIIPFIYKIKYSSWQISVYLARIYINRGAKIVVSHMKMWRVVLGIIHRDNYSVKATDFRHNGFLLFHAANVRIIF